MATGLSKLEKSQKVFQVVGNQIMNLPINHSNNVVSSQLKAITELSLALEKIIQETTTMQPQTISIFFDGTEVYRQYTADGSVFWWIEQRTALLNPPSIKLLCLPHTKES